MKPKPTITWLRDGKPLTDSRFVVSAEEDGTLTLKIASVELDDKSRITIRAENAFGSAGIVEIRFVVTLRDTCCNAIMLILIHSLPATFFLAKMHWIY